MWAHEFEHSPATRERLSGAGGRLSATPQFDGAGGTLVVVEAPSEPPGSLSGDGQEATIKLWTWPMDKPGPVSSRGAPDAVRSEPTPCLLEMGGKGFDPRKPPRYYGVALRVFVGLEAVDQFSAVYDVRDGSVASAQAPA